MISIGKTIRNIKNCIVSDETKYRRIKAGLCRGFQLPVNLKYDFRAFMGFYEMELLGYLRSYTRPGMCCYDIGSSVGYYAFALSRLVAPGKIYSVEADRSQFEILNETIKKNEFGSEIMTLNKFVGDILSDESNLTTLDHLVFEENWAPPDLIKMDIEGAEYKAFMGAGKVLSQYSPNIIVEVHSFELRDKCKQILEKKGYEVQIVNQSSLLPKRGGSYNGWLCARKEQ